jgi:hypothetical protein
MGNIRQRNNYEAAGVGGQRRLDALFNGEEWQWICVVDAMGVGGDADLTNAAQTFVDQTLVAGMKRLVASDKQRGGSNAGRSRAKACSAQYCGAPSLVT